MIICPFLRCSLLIRSIIQEKEIGCVWCVPNCSVYIIQDPDGIEMARPNCGVDKSLRQGLGTRNRWGSGKPMRESAGSQHQPVMRLDWEVRLPSIPGHLSSPPLRCTCKHALDFTLIASCISSPPCDFWLGTQSSRVKWKVGATFLPDLKRAASVAGSRHLATVPVTSLRMKVTPGLGEPRSLMTSLIHQIDQSWSMSYLRTSCCVMSYESSLFTGFGRICVTRTQRACWLMTTHAGNTRLKSSPVAHSGTNSALGSLRSHPTFLYPLNPSQTWGSFFPS